MNVFDELDILKQANRELTEQLEIAHIMTDKLEGYGISNDVDLIAHMGQFKAYRRRSKKYKKRCDQKQSKIDKIIKAIGQDIYMEIIRG